MGIKVIDLTKAVSDVADEVGKKSKEFQEVCGYLGCLAESASGGTKYGSMQSVDSVCTALWSIGLLSPQPFANGDGTLGVKFSPTELGDFVYGLVCAAEETTAMAAERVFGGSTGNADEAVVNEQFDEAAEPAEDSEALPVKPTAERWVGDDLPKGAGDHEADLLMRLGKWTEHVAPKTITLLLQSLEDSLLRLMTAGHPDAATRLLAAADTLVKARQMLAASSPAHQYASASILRRLSRQTRERQEAEQRKAVPSATQG